MANLSMAFPSLCTAKTRLVSTFGLNCMNATSLSTLSRLNCLMIANTVYVEGELVTGTPFACVTSAVIATVWDPSGALRSALKVTWKDADKPFPTVTLAGPEYARLPACILISTLTWCTEGFSRLQFTIVERGAPGSTSIGEG